MTMEILPEPTSNKLCGRCDDVMNIVMHVDFVLAKVLPADNKYIVHICVNSLASRNDCGEIQQGSIDVYNENLMLKAELAKKGQMVEKIIFDEVFLNNKPLNNQNAPEIPEIFKINEWQARLDAQDVSIANLREHIKKLKGKNVVEKDVRLNNPNVIASEMFKLDLAPLAPKLLNNRDAHIDYIKHSREHADIIREIVEHARALRPLDIDLDSGMKSSTSASRSQPSGNIKHNRIMRTTSSNMKNKVEDHPRSVVQIILWYLDSECSKHITGNRSQLINFVHKFLGTVRFRNDQIAKITGYGDYQMGNVTISRVYYVEGLGHNLFFVGQFCDSDLEVAFRKHTYYIRNLEGVDLLKGSRSSNLYTLSLEDMMLSSLICLLSKASKTKSWLWHRRLSHLNFDYITTLAKQGLVHMLPRMKHPDSRIFKRVMY
ncbi:retrovirus-related pol polyprotein from transposon TNT 1-94 [Tanacetum coccineum]